MKNFQKLALSLTVGIMAIGFSAFTSANKFAAVTYYQLQTDVYTKLANPPGDCDPTQSRPHSCTITYTVDPGVASFNYSSKPASGIESASKNLWAD